MALSVAIIWGTTFASTKILLEAGLSPASIMLYRFVLAYIGLWLMKPAPVFGQTLKDELVFMLMGITGGTLYFLAENTALGMTLSSNVALIVSTAPLLTIFISRIFLKDVRLNGNLIAGSVVAFFGMCLVVYNGRVILKLSPGGDLLALAAAFSWAFYTILLKLMDGKYSIYAITRQVFFYGIITLLPVFIFSPLTIDPGIIFQPKVLGNLLFLGLAASLMCYAIWNKTVKHLGAIVTSNYIYVVPIVALIFSALVLGEKITPIAILGACLILSGIWISGRKTNVGNGSDLLTKF